ncbi:hypothetical protein GPECTOR_61g796 [Gonium pectorale]|uniref:Uncharacterized protein n=1 Tax=Gonium pectorale TaxID=33097 RepID=A0A150G4Y3_GONPE|nr:hypothetical protein GPECTOR_61g796 [Gonium pectorale]|eukprot:KXZ44843.1 hypothetical protein GPECTOR_61g796 [Gonium pectorale]
MIQRAKSTLPPEARGLICDRLQEILGTPLMRRAAAAARAAGGKAGTPSKPPQSRAGRKPAWNSDWNAQQQPGSGTSWDDKAVGGAGAGGARTQGDRVVLLPSPTMGASSAGFGEPGRPTSCRYGLAGADGALRGDGPEHSHLLEQSTVSAIATLNPQAPAAQEAAARLRQYSQGQGTKPSAGAASPAPHVGVGAGGSRIPRPGAGAGAGDVASQSLRQLGSSRQQLGGSTSVSASRGNAARGSPAPLSAGSAGAAASASGALRSNGSSAHAGSAAGRQAAAGGEQGDGEEDDAYDDDFEEYAGSDAEDGEEGRRGAEGGAGAEGEEALREEGDDGLPDVDMLRHSVKALNGLVQLKIKQELAARQSTPAGAAAQPLRDSASPLAPVAAAGGDMLASLALIGTEGADGGGLDASGGLLDTDGLRQSDLEYLARLGAGEPHEGHDGAHSGDEHERPIEPGEPAGTAKAWGDRHPWGKDKAGEDRTGLELLRARQEREAQQQQARQQHPGPGQGQGQVRSSGVEEDDAVLLGETIPARARTAAAEQMQAISSALTALAGSGALAPNDAQDLQSQTDALYGSLRQLHQLMTGPKGAELRSPPGGYTFSPASGFSPSGNGSPSDSPDNTLARPAGATVGATGVSPLGSASGGSGGSGGRIGTAGRASAASASPPPLPLHELPAVESEGSAGSHMQLTPKNCLCAEDVAWMAGLVHSLSRSLQGEPGGLALPGY